MLIQFSDSNGAPVYVNPQYVIAVREEKHFGRPGVGTDAEYSDTLILTTKYEFNVQDPPDAVVREVNRASRELLGDASQAGGGPEQIRPPDEESG
jgi:hypothetical protein